MRPLALRLSPRLRFCLLAFLVGRLLFSGLAVVGWWLPHDRPEPATHWAPERPASGWLNAFAGFEHFDAQWYLQIARDGYRDGDPSAAYFPLYPLATRLAGVLVGDRWLLAGTLVSNVALLVALVLLHRLTSDVLSESAARWAVVLLLLNPMAFFLYAPYSESLFLLLALGCLLWLRQGRWVAATAAASLATATRSTGVVLGLAMAAEALHQEGWRPRTATAWRRLCSRAGLTVLTLSGVTSYLGYWALRGDGDAPLTTQRSAFQREASWPWTSLVDGVRFAAGSLDDPGAVIMNLIVALTLVTLLLAPFALRRYGVPAGAYVLGSLVVPLCLVRPYAPLTSMPRYYLVVFPITWALVEVTRSPALRFVAVAVSGSLLVFMTLLFTSWHDVL